VVTIEDVRAFALQLQVKFPLPRPSELRYNWVVARLDHLDRTEMRELVLDAWRMVVPKRVAAALVERDLR
jgi:hypothetical protein